MKLIIHAEIDVAMDGLFDVSEQLLLKTHRNVSDAVSDTLTPLDFGVVLFSVETRDA